MSTILTPEIREHIRQRVDEAPPATEAQRAIIAAIFRSSRTYGGR